MTSSTHGGLVEPDSAVLGAVADGDHEALRELYDRHAGWLLLRLSRRCADSGIVDEVVQDTFTAAWRNAGRYRGTGDVGAWLWGIAVRRLADRFRRKDPVRALVRMVRLEAATSAEDEVLVGVEHGAVGHALDRLSPELRLVMQTTVLDGLTTAEAARLLGIPRGTVKTRMMRARRILREELAT